jgi:hypothetical protein
MLRAHWQLNRTIQVTKFRESSDLTYVQLSLCSELVFALALRVFMPSVLVASCLSPASMTVVSVK